MISLPVKHAEGESCFLHLLFRGRNSHWWNFIFSLYCCCYSSSPLATLAHIFSKPWAAWKQKQHHQERAGLLWLSLLCFAVSAPSCALHKHRVPHTRRDSSCHARCDPQRSRSVAVACPIPRPAVFRPYVSSLWLLTAWAGSQQGPWGGKGKDTGETQYGLTGGENWPVWGSNA